MVPDNTVTETNKMNWILDGIQVGCNMYALYVAPCSVLLQSLCLEVVTCSVWPQIKDEHAQRD